MIKSQRLYVYMNGIKVGSLDKAGRGVMSFSYDETWLTMPGARPISLSLSLSAKPYTGDIVYNFFDNLLPDNDYIRERIQAKFQANTSHPFDLLAAIGKDCVGAIQILENENLTATKKIQGESLSKKQIAAILRGYQKNPLGMTEDHGDFRISIAGAQEKTALLRYDNKWQKPLADTPTSHIFKLPIGMIPYQQMDLRDSCENEWLCSKISKAFGFEIAECSIEIFENVKALVVERFDRKFSSDGTWLMRLPQEDMCQALGISSHLKYQSEGGPGINPIMDLLLGSEEAIQDRDTFFRAQILFWLLCAIDGHAKNFSVFIGPDGRYRLTPLYDIMSAYPFIENKQLSERKVKMAMAINGKNTHYRWHEIQYRHFLETAKMARYPQEIAKQSLDAMLDKVDGVIESVSKIIPKNFPEEIAESIFNGMRKAKKRFSI